MRERESERRKNEIERREREEERAGGKAELKNEQSLQRSLSIDATETS